MATSSASIKTISIVSLLGLLMFSVVWMFATGAVVSIPDHSLRGELFEIGRPIQAVAIDIDPDVRRPFTAAAVSGTRAPRAPRALEAVAKPVAAIVQQLTQPITAQPPTTDGEGSDGPSKRGSRGAKSKAHPKPDKAKLGKLEDAKKAKDSRERANKSGSAQSVDSKTKGKKRS